MTTSTIDMKVNPFARESDELLEGHSQIIKENDAQDDPLILEALNCFRKAKPDVILLRKDWDIAVKYIGPLPPDKIDVLLQQIKTLLHKERICYDASDFISAMIQRSYRAGFNDFTITTGDDAMWQFPDGLIGKKNNPLRYTIIGNTMDCGLIKYCQGVYKGSFVDIGNLRQNRSCDFILYGDAISLLGLHSYGSSFTLYGSAGVYPGDETKKCTFRTVRPDDYEALKQQVAKEAGNVVQLISREGQVLEEVRP